LRRCELPEQPVDSGVAGGSLQAQDELPALLARGAACNESVRSDPQQP
jgi:hypothetical protein